MLEVIPFTSKEALICIHWGNQGRWFVLEQISRVVFKVSSEKLRQKILYNGYITKNHYKIVRVSDKNLLKKIIAINLMPKDTREFYIIHLSSLDAFLKNYSKKASLFTRLYDCVHRLQYGKREELGLSQRRKLTSADKKYVAAKQKWKCAMCHETLPSRYEVDHIIQWSKGGSDELHNLQALCPNCHANKTESDRLEESEKKTFSHNYIGYNDLDDDINLLPNEEFDFNFDNFDSQSPKSYGDNEIINEILYEKKENTNKTSIIETIEILSDDEDSLEESIKSVDLCSNLVSIKEDPIFANRIKKRKEYDDKENFENLISKYEFKHPKLSKIV